MRTIKITIEYLGLHFKGWQIQRPHQRTVQGVITAAIKKICQHPVTVIGSGRTDSGVHALGQVAHFKTSSSLSCEKLLKALNAHLPQDVSITDLCNAPNDFHAQYSVITKTYRYVILNRQSRSVLDHDLCYFHPHRINVARMKRASTSLIGTKDFKSFVANDPANRSQQKLKSTIRTITDLSISRNKDYIYIKITANGFLYKMVRNIVGTLIKIGEGTLPEKMIQDILKAKDRSTAGPTAPAKGLCLLEVKY